MAWEHMKQLAAAIGQLRIAADEVRRLSAGLPVAEKNSYMIMQQIEILEIEICDPVEALSNGSTMGSSQ